MTTFHGCLLVEKKNAEPEILETNVRLHFQNEPIFSIDSDYSVLLAGGFSSFFSKSTYPFSATLQLNHDRTSLSREQLLRLALAEQKRFAGASWRSYISEADMRVCVIGSKAASVEKFLDTYGGVLDIEPLLLQELHPDISTAVDIRIEREENGLRLEYAVRLPLSVTDCTYCGACGPVCPENCISPRLFLDLQQCTYCGECGKVCSTKAIDINRIEERVMEVPALVILDDCSLEAGEDVPGVYHEGELETFFATLFSCLVDESITWDASICQYSSRLGAGCDLCVRGCKYGAVTQGSEGVVIDPMVCRECGACVGVCPTGALQNRKFDDATFVEFFDAVKLPEGATVIIGSDKQLHEFWWQSGGRCFDDLFFFEYPKISNLSLFHFLHLLHKGAGKLVLLSGAVVGRELRAQTGLANSLVTSLYGGKQRVLISTVRDAEKLLGRFPPLGQFLEMQSAGGFTSRRKALAGELKLFVAASGKNATVRSDSSLGFGTLFCNSSQCTHCLACLNGCRTGALSVNQERLSLNHTGVMCIDCGLCVQVCPEDALELLSEFTLNDDFFSSREIAKAEPMTCKSCGKVFGTRKSYERVMAILSRKESVDITHFEYCDTCRVVRLFEE
jgi:ferredoxin